MLGGYQMQEYGDIVIKNLPLMLNNETKGKASVIIASYMNAMLRKTKTREDLEIFAQILAQCKKFSLENNLGGLNRTCDEWDHEAVIKLNEILGISNKQPLQNNNYQIVQQLQQFLETTKSQINKTGMIGVDDFQNIADQLDQLEASIVANGDRYLTQEQIEQFRQEIHEQREQIRINYAMIDDILETNHMSR